jgi:hypothetical protein
MRFQTLCIRSWKGFPATILTALSFLAVPLFAQESSGAAQAVPTDVMERVEALTKRVEQLEQQLREHESALQPITVVPSAKATAPAQRYTAPIEEPRSQPRVNR